MTPGTDTPELLGCFEQADAAAAARAAVALLRAALEAALAAALEAAPWAPPRAARVAAVYEALWALRGSLGAGAARPFAPSMAPESGAAGAAGPLGPALEDPAATAAAEALFEPGAPRGALRSLLEALARLAPPAAEAALEAFWFRGGRAAPRRAGGGRFVWSDGVVVRAMERGEWLVLDNVNYCGASVLDRLNGLLELGGRLVLDECGAAGGAARVVRQHPGFRVFLLADAASGDVSRAMRNRCVEISVPGPLAGRPAALLDLSRRAAALGVPGVALPVALASAHLALAGAAEEETGRPREASHAGALLLWAAGLAFRLGRGESAAPALREAFALSYGAAEPPEAALSALAARRGPAHPLEGGAARVLTARDPHGALCALLGALAEPGAPEAEAERLRRTLSALFAAGAWRRPLLPTDGEAAGDGISSCLGEPAPRPAGLSHLEAFAASAICCLRRAAPLGAAVEDLRAALGGACGGAAAAVLAPPASPSSVASLAAACLSAAGEARGRRCSASRGTSRAAPPRGRAARRARRGRAARRLGGAFARAAAAPGGRLAPPRRRLARRGRGGRRRLRPRRGRRGRTGASPSPCSAARSSPARPGPSPTAPRSAAAWPASCRSSGRRWRRCWPRWT